MERNAGRQLLNVLNSTPQKGIMYMAWRDSKAIAKCPEQHTTAAYNVYGMEKEAGRQLLNVLNSTPQQHIMCMTWRERQEGNC
jgi:hypothetical protein